MNENKEEYKEEYERTAGIQAPMPTEEDGPPPTDSLPPAVFLIGVVIGIAFLIMLAWGFAVVFGP